MPELLDIVSSGRCDAVMQHRALSILRGLLVQLGVLSGAFQRQFLSLVHSIWAAGVTGCAE
eukprot:1159132-Pelagomonas_calceolata.AAC.7